MFGRSDVGLEPILSLQDPLVGRIVRTLADEIEGGPGDRLLVDGLSRALAVQVMRRFAPFCEPSSPPRGMGGERLRRVLDYVEAHLGEEMTLAELADVACFSTYYFSRCFKQAVGMGLHQYVARRRVERAKDLMRGTAHPLATIAHAVGFTDQSHFTSTFRRETGITPGKFRLALA
jgi:AraC family transcriptional regulator